MKRVVQEYIQARSNLLSYFKVDGDFIIKTAVNHKWRVIVEDGWSIVRFWKDENDVTELAVVRKTGQPLVYKARDYTLVMAIECIKIGFVFKNKNYVND